MAGSDGQRIGAVLAGFLIPIVGSMIAGAIVTLIIDSQAGLDAANDSGVIVANVGVILVAWGLLAHATHWFWRRRSQGIAAAVGIHVSALFWIGIATLLGYLLGRDVQDRDATAGLISITATSMERGLTVAAQVLVALMIVFAVDWSQHRRDQFPLRLIVTGVPFAFVAAATMLCVYASFGDFSNGELPADTLPLTLAGLGAGVAGAATLLALPPLRTHEDDS